MTRLPHKISIGQTWSNLWQDRLPIGYRLEYTFRMELATSNTSDQQPWCQVYIINQIPQVRMGWHLLRSGLIYLDAIDALGYPSRLDLSKSQQKSRSMILTCWECLHVRRICVTYRQMIQIAPPLHVQTAWSIKAAADGLSFDLFNHIQSPQHDMGLCSEMVGHPTWTWQPW